MFWNRINENINFGLSITWRLVRNADCEDLPETSGIWICILTRPHKRFLCTLKFWGTLGWVCCNLLRVHTALLLSLVCTWPVTVLTSEWSSSVSKNSRPSRGNKQTESYLAVRLCKGSSRQTTCGSWKELSGALWSRLSLVTSSLRSWACHSHRLPFLRGSFQLLDSGHDVMTVGNSAALQPV